MSEKLISIVENAQVNAENNISKLSPDILGIDGMSGNQGRHFLNNLVFDGCRYLEVGSHLGSTLCSALYLNNPEISFSVDLTLHSQFTENVNRFVTTPHTTITGDCFNIDLKQYNISDIDVYFFDGPHSMRDHEMALEYYIDCLADTFIFAVDDWNGVEAREGTETSIKALGLEVLHKVGLPEDLSNYGNNRHGYWNGIGVYVLQK